MTIDRNADETLAHSHAFLGRDHARGERNAWMVIALCTAMMIAEIVGGLLFGSIALVADGFHMSTHAGALLLAALAYTLARRSADDPRFTFGPGKFGDLAGFASAVILAMIALLIGYESAARFFSPTPIRFAQAIPIAALGLVVNVVSAWLLSRGDHGHHHHHHGGGRAHDHDHALEELARVEDPARRLPAGNLRDGRAAALSLALAKRRAARRRRDFHRDDASRRRASALRHDQSRRSSRIRRRNSRAA